MPIRLFDVSNQLEVQQIISLVNDAFQEDAFFKRAEKRQRLKTRPDDTIGVENLSLLLQQSEFLVYVDDDESSTLKGCIRVDPNGNSFGMLAVPRYYSNRGIGKKLVHAAERWLKDKGCTRVEITVVNIRIPVMQFYANLGYEICGKAVDFDEALGGKFLSEGYRGIVKFVVMGKELN